MKEISAYQPVPEHPQIPEHQLLHPIASGAYGEVWLALNAVGTRRAVKLVHRDRHLSVESFEREFNGLRQFEPISRTHEGLVDILTLGLLPEGIGFYYVMELADSVVGCSIPVLGCGELPTPPSGRYAPRTLCADLKASGALPAADVIGLGLKLTSALAHLHAHGLVHRDVKPSNILFIGGEPTLADAGLVASAADARSLVGTAGYIAPEGPGTPQADLYALGKVLYEAAFGKDRQEFPALPTNVATRPDHARLLELNAIILKACVNDPKNRYRSSEEIRKDLALLEAGRSVRRKRLNERCWRVAKKVALATAMFGLLIQAAPLLFGGRSSAELHSPMREVNNLVDRGNFCVLRETPERLDQALTYFSRAIELDPKFPPAYVGLFRVRLHQHGGVANPSTNAAVNLRAAAKNLMEHAPSTAEARIASSFIKFLDGQLPAALVEGLQATRARATSKEGQGVVHALYGFLLINAGYPEASLNEYLLAERIFPSDPAIQQQLGHPYLVQREFDLALAHYQKAIELEPGHWAGYFSIAAVYEATGKYMEAIDEFEAGELAQLRVGEDQRGLKDFYNVLRNAYRETGAEGYWRKRLEFNLRQEPPVEHDIAINLARLNRMDEAYLWLRNACQHGRLGGLWFDLCWDQQDPRFREIAAKVGFRPQRIQVHREVAR